MNNLGERLFKLRRDKKLSQEEVINGMSMMLFINNIGSIFLYL